MIAISDKAKCTGCHTCAAICPKQCISMERDAEGFWYPKADVAYCIECGLCEQVCPVLSPLHHQKNDKDITVYAAVNTDDEIRRESSSGGIFTLIAAHVIEQGGVVFGAAFNHRFGVEPCFAETMEQLQAFRGSKYVQSKIGDTYRQAEDFLKAGRNVLFTGTPCQIEGLLSYLQKDYDSLLTQDIVCHGVPSPMVWERYIQYREKKDRSKAKQVSFRHKKNGWKQYSMMIRYENETEYMMPLTKDPYMQAFLENLCLRPSCYTCAFKKKYRLSDFTLADFWGIEYVLPEMNDDRGISLVLINSEKGKSLFLHIESAVIMKQVELESAVRYNSAIMHSVPLTPRRELFMQAVQTEDFERVKKAFLDPSAVQLLIRKGKGLLKRLLALAGK